MFSTRIPQRESDRSRDAFQDNSLMENCSRSCKNTPLVLWHSPGKSETVFCFSLLGVFVVIPEITDVFKMSLKPVRLSGARLSWLWLGVQFRSWFLWMAWMAWMEQWNESGWGGLEQSNRHGRRLTVCNGLSQNCKSSTVIKRLLARRWQLVQQQRDPRDFGSPSGQLLHRTQLLILSFLQIYLVQVFWDSGE